ncbi:MAG: bifunctional proline dehydrogenase/L-glutamate gamma-semialdehyde dehydrogenase PutA [Rhodospirillaceae bacterium]|nr:bifunctional proline dehydrogenase/L-glutamate gamma-semialdehyde dehydrogenase PutA [Rhodospirillaceae bacterium]
MSDSAVQAPGLRSRGGEGDRFVAGEERLRAAIRDVKFAPEQAVVDALLDSWPYDDDFARLIEDAAAAIIVAVRADRSNRTVLDRFLAEYGLSNREGIALMCLAEALLRIPDSATADRLIADKIGVGEWSAHLGHSDDLLVNASTWALILTGQVVSVDREFSANPATWLRRVANRLGEPVIQGAVRQAMRILGTEFVLGRTIEEALERSFAGRSYSYDMLGEAARDGASAERYFAAYMHAVESLRESAKDGAAEPPSVSVKLSALHPRYEFSQRERVLAELGPRLRALAERAAEIGIGLTVDAEEADRLDLSLDLYERVAKAVSPAGGPGVGIVIQAYGKRALTVIDWTVALAREIGRPIPVRLVKGAYWDAEIKHAQVMGYPDFPVFTRKAATDLSYLVCARKILAHPGEIAGQFATHNAHTVAAVMALAGEARHFEFQRLHGMGESLYRAAARQYESFPALRVYAPVGSHEDLLAYLVRRLLENGANTSFVNRVLNERLPPERIAADPVGVVCATRPAAHPGIAHPGALFGPARANSSGIDLTDPSHAGRLQRRCVRPLSSPLRAASILFGHPGGGAARAVFNPANRDERLGYCADANPAEIRRAFESATEAQPDWEAAGGEGRAQLLEAVADKLEDERERLIPILVKEAGKTLPDAVAEVREAVDFCRYYAAEARRLFAGPRRLPGPTGESNQLSLHGRGVFVCISPWNFPLAIFAGQISAALMAGNTVIAKPAEETPLIAFEAVRLMHAAGIPVNALNLVTGDATVGEALVRHPQTAGVAFTGSTGAARAINRALAARDGPVAPLIAETGGQNAMLVDSSALLEQVTDDVIQSAFGSAGQRCSALRVLYLQEDIADKAIDMIAGAMDELRVGDPARLETDVGPIISDAAASSLRAHVSEMTEQGACRHVAPLSGDCAKGAFVAPALLEIDGMETLSQEHFGPILHVARYPGSGFASAVRDAMSSGYGLTLGLHSRIEARADKLFELVPVGNVYVNRNMIGAVVGSQPFGGQGLSGTGPKAGGPHYLLRFATEKTLTLNTTATGGNAELLSLEPETP